MAAGSTDLVNCARLAEESAELLRSYELRDLPRVKDLLADASGSLDATFAFAKLGSGRIGAAVTVSATPLLVCQRCMQGFGFELATGSDVEFATSDVPENVGSERELFRMKDGQVSLRELAEEELLLALPIAPMCGIPLTCGRAPHVAVGTEALEGADEMRRPFSALQDLLKKT